MPKSNWPTSVLASWSSDNAFHLGLAASRYSGENRVRSIVAIIILTAYFFSTLKHILFLFVDYRRNVVTCQRRRIRRQEINRWRRLSSNCYGERPLAEIHIWIGLTNIRMPRSTKTCCLAASHYLGRNKKCSWSL